MKTVREERLSLVITLTREGGVVGVSCRADYEVSSDDLTVTREFIPTLTGVQETAIKSFGANIVSQIKAREK